MVNAVEGGIRAGGLVIPNIVCTAASKLEILELSRPARSEAKILKDVCNHVSGEVGCEVQNGNANHARNKVATPIRQGEKHAIRRILSEVD